MAATTSLGVASKTRTFPFHSPIVRCARQVRRSSSAALVGTILVDPVAVTKDKVKRDSYSPSSSAPPGSPPKGEGEPEWKKLNSKELGITTKMITKPTRLVLNGLRKKGYEVYLVGGCVRDLILKRPPKDFDVITSATLYQVMRTFSRCEIVGRRFPICHVHVNDCIIEVSSFKTSERNSYKDLAYSLTKPPEYDELDFVRWRNCLKRDFTINGLMFDPYSNLVYDYIGGLEDIKKSTVCMHHLFIFFSSIFVLFMLLCSLLYAFSLKVRTVIPACTSFQDDCARILRGIRIAARLNFRFTKETALSIRDFGCTVLRLDKSRLHMEMNYMLSFGSAEASLRLLWKLGLLEILLPIQAAYFVQQGFRRRDKRSNMLLTLFSNLDKLLAPNKPCHCCLWAGLLAFHHALVNEPRNPLVVATFALVVHNGGNLSEAISIARGITHRCDPNFPELLEPLEEQEDQNLLDEVLDLASSVKSSLSMMTDENYISQSMAEYEDAPYSNLVLVSLQVYLKVCDMFGCATSPGKSGFGFVPKRGSKIDYERLVQGDLAEVRHVFARVVFDTVYPPNLDGNNPARVNE